MLDPIAEMITRIKNAQRAGKKEVEVSASKLKLAMAKILEKEGFVGKVAKEKNDFKEIIIINLKYNDISRTHKTPAITEIKRKSHEGQRIYVKSNKIKNIKNKFGIAIISTSQGVMTGAEARKSGLGGEYICEVW